jgi:hypothetical protein
VGRAALVGLLPDAHQTIFPTRYHRAFRSEVSVRVHGHNRSRAILPALASMRLFAACDDSPSPQPNDAASDQFDEFADDAEAALATLSFES